jgi:polyisoprenoid-binding protein YceI
MASCTHDNEIFGGSGAVITRGTEKLSLTDTKVSFDKSHSNVMWETAYLGSTALLTGRFNTFGFTPSTGFNFDEANPAGINFEGYVWINSVNTGEPGRDQGCLQTTYGVNTTMTTETANVAMIKSKSVELSKTDKGYIVKFDFTFHGVTKELTGKLNFLGKTTTGSGATLKYVYGFSFDFQFLAKTDFAITSSSIADNVSIRCNAIFRQLP